MNNPTKDLTKTQIRKANRETLIRYATRNCLPVIECMEDSERDALSLTQLRNEILMDMKVMEVWLDRVEDAKNSAF